MEIMNKFECIFDLSGQLMWHAVDSVEYQVTLKLCNWILSWDYHVVNINQPFLTRNAVFFSDLWVCDICATCKLQLQQCRMILKLAFYQGSTISEIGNLNIMMQKNNPGKKNIVWLQLFLYLILGNTIAVVIIFLVVLEMKLLMNSYSKQ